MNMPRRLKTRGCGLRLCGKGAENMCRIEYGVLCMGYLVLGTLRGMRRKNRFVRGLRGFAAACAHGTNRALADAAQSCCHARSTNRAS